jgi:hypothetical protein
MSIIWMNSSLVVAAQEQPSKQKTRRRATPGVVPSGAPGTLDKSEDQKLCDAVFCIDEDTVIQLLKARVEPQSFPNTKLNPKDRPDQ